MGFSHGTQQNHGRAGKHRLLGPAPTEETSGNVGWGLTVTCCAPGSHTLAAGLADKDKRQGRKIKQETCDRFNVQKHRLLLTMTSQKRIFLSQINNNKEAMDCHISK